MKINRVQLHAYLEHLSIETVQLCETDFPILYFIKYYSSEHI